jgi:3-oxoacyl-[acyl-carrier-protein] synthase II
MPPDRARRVVVTGMGAVSPLGLTLAETWRHILEGRSGIQRITRFDPTGWPVQIAGEVPNFDFSLYVDSTTRELAPLFPRPLQLGAAAAAMAVEDAGLDTHALPPDRIGVAMGALTQSTEIRDIERWRAYAEEYDPPRYPVVDAELDLWLPQVGIIRALANRWNCGGPYWITSTACAAGTMALGAALKSIRRGEADVMLAGGFDSMVTETSVLSFSLLGALSTRNDAPQAACRPFARSRDGFVLAEGAAVLVLEDLEHARRRGARIVAELVGYGASMTSDHITDASADGRHPALAMQWALANARLDPTQIQYVNAHGTSTRSNDASETQAIHKAFGTHAPRLAVSSTKSMTGHLVHAAGALEAALTVLAIRDQIAPPTINLDDPDPQCDLDYVPHSARPMTIDAALSNSFAFGGNNATLVFRRFSERI